ncbi:D-cysteine desulfhydrase family protein [Parvibaculum sp. MBR-TMA-1.3b-4.2]|jgi:D-cysteine desulfhydrase/L-cysteate sulfo-lyase
MSDKLAALPRKRLAHLPTPLDELPRLREALSEMTENGVPRLFIKRDDCTGLAFGGNKTRKLEFLIGEALAQGCDTVITAGAAQSNHARQTAAAAAAAGLDCVLVLFDTVPYQGRDYRRSGNLLLDDLLGARVIVEASDADPVKVFERVMQELASQGRKAYFVPVGGSNVTGTMGYVNAYLELADQLEALGIAASHIVHGSSSGGTQAGLVAGQMLRPGGPAVLGINVYRDDTQAMANDIHALAVKTAEALGADLPPNDVVALEAGYLGDGYGVPTAQMRRAVETLARLEGVFLDPVYSGKAMAGLIGLILDGRMRAEDNVVFLHTGGAPGLFAYAEEFSDR